MTGANSLSDCTRTAKKNRLPDFAAVLANLREIDTGLVNVDGDTGWPPDAAELAIRPKTVLHLDPGQVIGKQPSEPEKNVVVIAVRCLGHLPEVSRIRLCSRTPPRACEILGVLCQGRDSNRMFPRF